MWVAGNVALQSPGQKNIDRHAVPARASFAIKVACKARRGPWPPNKGRAHRLCLQRATDAMNTQHRFAPEWPAALRRYLVGSLFLHLAWEVLQLPLYTLWSEPLPRQAFAVLHCTVGDLMIAGVTLLAALAIVGRPGWPKSDTLGVWLLILTFASGYTAYSEWLNVNVRGSWAYSPLMPRLPVTGTGLSPLLQWVVVPTLAIRVAIGRWPWSRRTEHGS